MKLRQKILQLLSPATEKERQQFRMVLSCATAHAEDLNRTACLLVDAMRCTGRRQLPSKGSKPT